MFHQMIEAGTVRRSVSAEVTTILGFPLDEFEKEIVVAAEKSSDGDPSVS